MDRRLVSAMRRALLLLLCCLCGCAGFGPSALRSVHPGYGHALATVLNRQFLLNLVRLRYRDTPFFLDVGTITAQQTVSGALGLPLDLGLSGDGFASAALRPNVGGTISQTPTIVFLPLQGKDYLHRLLAPMPLEDLLLLTQSGWSIARVLRIAVDRMNDVPNAVAAAGPTPEVRPAYEEFARVAAALRALQQHDRLRLEVRLNGKGVALVLRITPGAEAKEAEEELRQRLGLAPTAWEFVFTSAPGAGPDALTVRTRSVMGMLFYLSHGVEVPPEHLRRGLVTVTRDADGSAFDWGRVLAGLLRVRAARREPADAFVKVPYRGHWFYIRDDDLDSKATFLLLSQLFNLQSDTGRSTAPLLTLPVGR